MSKCTIIGVAGGSGSGKTTLCKILAELLAEHCTTISSDDYYHANDGMTPLERARLNFDHPDALELDLLAEHLASLRGGQAINVPKYCFKEHTRLETGKRVEPRPVVLVEGIMIFSSESLRSQLDVRIFVDADESLRFQRRLERDIIHRRRSKDCVTQQWNSTVAPMFQQFVLPTRRHAHLVVNSNEPNESIMQLLAHGIRANIR